ncbi:MAG TPA: glycosyltransferase family 39 protein [Fimbriiglobus sp.]|nr:glycosyltransferase family 39 protein [Fimbriiglobus sp.]
MPAHRFAHYLILGAVCGLLTLPNLGAHSLWDMDEGVNAECTREMLEAGTWVVPTFNWELRTAKPVMTYWIQRFSYLAFGVSEWSARLPSVLLGLGSVLLTYELGRRMFGAATGLLAGVALASAVQFCVLSHAATPDAPLIFFTVLTFTLFWFGHENGSQRWIVPTAFASGLAVLSKGPIGLILPGLAVVAYFAWNYDPISPPRVPGWLRWITRPLTRLGSWTAARSAPLRFLGRQVRGLVLAVRNRETRRLFDPRLTWGWLTFGLVALPWYVLVTSETKGEYIEEFFGNHNVNRFLAPMENHKGPVVYYVGALVVLFAPWSCFIGGALWYAVKGARNASPPSPPVATGGLAPSQRADRFLLCWFFAYLVFFSIAQTKLPNYIAPLYPALAILTARFLVRWGESAINPARWVMPTAIAGVALTGILLAAGLVLASGVLPLSLKGMRTFPGLEAWAWVGLIPLAGAAVMAWALRAGQRPVAVAAVAVASVGMVGVIAAGPPLVVDRYKAAKELVLTSGARQTDRDIRLAALLYFQDSQSIVFYAGRKVEIVHSAEQANQFLAMPRPAYLFVPEPIWAEHFVGKPATPPHRVVAKKYDFYRNADILVVTNEPVEGFTSRPSRESGP